MIYINNDCMACGMCLDYCKQDAIHTHSTHGYGQCVIDQLKCKNCRACLKVDCPADAIREVKESE